MQDSSLSSVRAVLAAGKPGRECFWLQEGTGGKQGQEMQWTQSQAARCSCACIHAIWSHSAGSQEAWAPADLKGASQWDIMADTASFTTRLPASLLLLPLSLTMARREGRLPAPRASRHCFSPMSHTYRLSMATPAVIACRFTCAAPLP